MVEPARDRRVGGEIRDGVNKKKMRTDMSELKLLLHMLASKTNT